MRTALIGPPCRVFFTYNNTFAERISTNAAFTHVFSARNKRFCRACGDNAYQEESETLPHVKVESTNLMWYNINKSFIGVK